MFVALVDIFVYATKLTTQSPIKLVQEISNGVHDNKANHEFCGKAGHKVGDHVGDKVGNKVRNKVRNNISNKVSNKVSDEVGNKE